MPTIEQPEHLDTKKSRILSSTTTTIPPIVFSQIAQTNSSPETIASLLNEAEWKYSSMQRTLYKNRKRVYPYWKVCKICSTIYPCLTREQAVRNKTCSRECAVESERRTPRRHWADHSPNKICPVCGKAFYKPLAWQRKAKTNYCSASCRSKAECAPRLIKHNKEHPTPITEERKQTLRAKMTGEANPAWKGGVTYRHRRGNYVNVRYVLCPKEFLPMARKDGYVMEHRLVVAKAIGRLLKRTEAVHHINHNPLDNREENLMLFSTNREHKLYEANGEPQPLWHG